MSDFDLQPLLERKGGAGRAPRVFGVMLDTLISELNKAGKVSNGNYLWISYFHSYLAPKGRAGFVMSSQASTAGRGERRCARSWSIAATWT